MCGSVLNRQGSSPSRATPTTETQSHREIQGMGKPLVFADLKVFSVPLRLRGDVLVCERVRRSQLEVDFRTLPDKQAAQRKTCADRLLPGNFGSFSRDRHCALARLAFVRVELVLNSRLTQLARVCRELRIAGFTNSARRDIADSFCNPKTALCHNSVSHGAGKCASPASDLPPGENVDCV